MFNKKEYPIGEITLSNEGQTVLYLSFDEAVCFATFRKYQTLWEKVFSSNPKNTEITLFIDNKGTMRMIKQVNKY